MGSKVQLRLNWVKLYKQLNHAGKVCEYYGISRLTLRKCAMNYWVKKDYMILVVYQKIFLFKKEMKLMKIL